MSKKYSPPKPVPGSPAAARGRLHQTAAALGVSVSVLQLARLDPDLSPAAAADALKRIVGAQAWRRAAAAGSVPAASEVLLHAIGSAKRKATTPHLRPIAARPRRVEAPADEDADEDDEDDGTIDADDMCTCGHVADEHEQLDGACQHKGCKCEAFEHADDEPADDDDERPKGRRGKRGSPPEDPEQEAMYARIAQRSGQPIAAVRASARAMTVRPALVQSTPLVARRPSKPDNADRAAAQRLGVDPAAYARSRKALFGK